MAPTGGFSGVCWEELHYCALASQSNIYGMTQVCAGNENKLIISCLQAKVTCVTLQNRLPSTQELAFTYIPSNAEIISIDAFNRAHDGQHGIVVAIAFIKPVDGEHDRHSYLNVYCEWETGFETDMERVSEGCQSLELSFVPYQLYHADVYCNGQSRETVFLLSGSDQQIHLYREAKNTHMFVKDEVSDYFPEMVDLPSVVLRMQCLYDDQTRFTVIGCQAGHVILAITNTLTKACRRYCVQHDSPISSVNIFKVWTDLNAPTFLCKQAQTDKHPTTNDYHVLVTSSLEPAVVYTCVIRRGLSDVQVLPDSDSADCVLCSTVADVDFDGQNEIILGTYGQEVLIYKFKLKRTERDGSRVLAAAARSILFEDIKDVRRNSPESCLPSPACLPAESAINLGGAGSRNVFREQGEFILLSRQSMPDPVLGLTYIDLTADGLNELVVLSLNGLHVLQHDLQQVEQLLRQRIAQGFTEQSSDLKTVVPLTDVYVEQELKLQNLAIESDLLTDGKNDSKQSFVYA